MIYSKSDEIEFSTGKKMTIVCGVIGLAPNGDITEGYDNDNERHGEER